MTEPQPATALDRNRARVRGAKRWIRRVRHVLAFVLVLLVVYVALSYRVYQLPGSAGDASPLDDIAPGGTVLLLSLNLWRAPKLGDVVLYERPGQPAELLIGRIAGLPGESVTRVGPSMSVGGRTPPGVGFSIGADVPIADGDHVPAAHYLILADTDAVSYADSRDFGYVPAGLIRRKVIMDLSPLLGGRSPED